MRVGQAGAGHRAAAVVAATALLTVGCSGHRAGEGAASSRVPGCVRDVTFWTNHLLAGDGDPALDYQELGLSGSTYEMVRALVQAHRSVGLPRQAMSPAEQGRAAALCLARERRRPRQPAGDYGRVWPAG